MSSAIKKVELLVKENKLEEAKVALSNAFAIIDSAASKNILHNNNAANKKAKLSKKVCSIVAEEVKAEPVVEAKEEAPVEAVVEEKKPARKPRAKKTEEAKAE